MKFWFTGIVLLGFFALDFCEGMVLRKLYKACVADSLPRGRKKCSMETLAQAPQITRRFPYIPGSHFRSSPYPTSLVLCTTLSVLASSQEKIVRPQKPNFPEKKKFGYLIFEIET